MSGHDVRMKQGRGRTSSHRRAIPGPLAGKRAADSRARALASTIRKLMAAGFVSRRTLADELNRKGVPTDRGGSWHGTTVERMLTGLGLITSGNNVLANKQAADVRAKALASTIRALRAKGLVSSKTIARKLNEREDTNGTGQQMAPQQR